MNAHRPTLTVLGALCAAVSTLALWSAPALAAAPEAPEVTVEAPVPATTATVKGVLNPNAIAPAEAGSYEFLYKQGSECEGGGKAPEPPGLAIGLEHEKVSEGLSGLAPNTQYTLCLREETAGGAALSPAVTFITAPAPPIVLSEATALPVRASEATLEAQINPNNQKTTYFFEYSTEAAGETLEGAITTLNGAGALAAEFGERLASVSTGGVLQAGKTYFYRVIAENQQSKTEGKPVKGKVQSFTTAIPPETPETLKTEPITATTATLHGVVNPKAPGNAGSYEFLYKASATECEGGETSGGSATGTMAEKVEAKLTGLLPSTTYAFCLLARNEAGETALSSPPVTFSTLPAPPAIEGESASSVLSTEAVLNAQINPEGQSTSYHVEYGTSEAYGQSTPETSAGAGFTASSVQVRLSGLQAGSTYHYRFVATNASHETTRSSEDHAFTTQPAPVQPGSGHCPNEALRTGRSASLPDCRAYELVTPSELGRTQALTFTGGSTVALAGADGEALALETVVPLEPNPSFIGARDVFRRNQTDGWEAKSVVAPGAAMQGINMKLFSKDFSQVAFERLTRTSADLVIEAGPVGGPDALVADLPSGPGSAELSGASANLGHVLFTSVDHNLMLAPTGTDEQAHDLYDWTGEHLELVNVQGGAFANPCGATLGYSIGEHSASFGQSYSASSNAVSADGSKIFFTSPDPTPGSTEPGCQEPARLYMRVNGGETVEVSKPESGVTPPEILPSRYNYATPDRSKVFFNTKTALTAGETPAEASANKLFEYDTEEPEGKRLKLVVAGFPEVTGVGKINGEGVIFSEDGSTVFVWSPPNGGFRQISRLDTATGKSSFVANAYEPHNNNAPSYSTPHGDFYLFFAAGPGVEDEPRGAGHEELYRYALADGSVMCVTCGAGVAPAEGEVSERVTLLARPDNNGSPLAQLSENGQEVFFETTARLVPQDTNSTETEISSANGTPGLDVYEWEAQGAGGCKLAQGCTHLLSGGEASGPSTFIGASADGRDVFFAAPAQLAPQATPEFPNIYDARVDGGFAPSSPAPECTSCQGVGSTPPLFSPGASLTFTGAGNPVAPVSKPAVKSKRCKKSYVKRKGRCVKQRPKKRARRSSARSATGGKRS